MNVIWVGPGWYKLLSFAVGDKKIVQVSSNKTADLGADCYWCDTITNCRHQFEEGRNIVKSKREVY